MISHATDDAPSMTGRQAGVVTHMKKSARFIRSLLCCSPATPRRLTAQRATVLQQSKKIKARALKLGCVSSVKT